ncbi:hypothetical protein ACFZB4_42645 [Streptomyces pseudovenezuelae]|uniref:hypothetical protein n=1 Tax=Streptomyces pseudovenezuelae TaxID=67350 RepID=UPI0036E6E311
MAVLSVVLGLTALLWATPASAHPDWQTYSANSNWKCGESRHIQISTQVVSQVCLITTPDKRKGQLVLVVSNRSTKTIELKGAEFDSDIYGRWDGNSDLGGGFCGFYALPGGQARGCFGATVELPCGVGIAHQGSLWVNSADEWRTAPFSTDSLC